MRPVLPVKLLMDTAFGMRAAYPPAYGVARGSCVRVPCHYEFDGTSSVGGGRMGTKQLSAHDVAIWHTVDILMQLDGDAIHR